MTLVDVRRLEFLREDDRRKNSLALVVAAFDEKNKLIDGIERLFDFNLQESSHASLVQYGVSSSVDFNLPAGRYKIRIVIRDALKSQIGSFSRLVEIP